MDSSDFAPLGKRSLSQLNRGGETIDANGRHKRYHSSSSRKPSSSKTDETVFKILCPASKTGGIIGKGGSIIKSIREDTGAMIRIEDAVPGVDVRVVTISARAVRPALQKQKGENGPAKEIASDEGQEEEADLTKYGEVKQPDGEVEQTDGEANASPAQEALLRVHLRIIEVEPGQDSDQKDSYTKTTAKLLVPTVQVGCVLGKKGKIIEQMREATGAQIRVLSKDQLPGCAAPTDEVVQITGDLAAVKKALYAVSSRLQDNPAKDKAQLHDSLETLRAKGSSMLPTGNSLGSHMDVGRHFSPPRPSVMGGSASFVSDRGPRMDESFSSMGEEVTFRILCPKEKIGSIIGKGGSIVRNIREETGAKIKIDVSGPESDERVVLISATEHPDDTVSKAQQALMRVHAKVIDPGPDKDAVVTSKLLVPSDQVGCLIGKGGAIIAEMRKLTRANVRIYGKEQLPPCASESDELVQVVGDIKVSQDALMQIATKLRNNLFYGKYGENKFNSGSGPVVQGGAANPFGLGRRPEPVSPGRLYPPLPDVSLRGTSLLDVLRGSSQAPVRGSWPSQEIGGRSFPDYGLQSNRERPGDLIRSNAAIVTSTTVEVVVPERVLGSIIGQSGSNLTQIRQISGAKVNIHESRPGASERTVEISGTPDQTHAAQSLLQAFILSGQ